jgi:class 3 adenylate cyclase/tetratricopeptide (TPR) repeat protein
MEGANMKCQKCKFENPEGIKFCGECGAKLERVCPNCKSSSPPNFKFCGECGHSFIVSSKIQPKELSFDEKLNKIQKYLPKGLTEKILAQRDRIEGERKQVTVMFCDMEGFTSLVEQQGAEEAYSLMDLVYEVLIHKVHDYEGTINEMTGDGIMALFGAPIALEDAPQRAIRSAFAIHREMAKFNDRLKEERKGIPPLKMRIGIHSGPVVVGTLGNDLRVEFKAVGETVNLASRMEGFAEPGTTYISGNTFKLTEGLFRFEALGDRQFKGVKDPVAVYRVIAPSSHKTRFDVNAERGLTSFVGRDRELELLFESLERVKEGAGQAFSIIGEAGIGKSRFLYEFRKTVSNEDITFLEGKCLSYGKIIPYHPISDILRGNFEIEEGDTDEIIRKKVKSGLEILEADEATTLPYLLELLAVKDSGIDRIQISPEGRKDRIIGAVKQIIFKGAQIRPLIIAIEDLHWADQSTNDALKWILEAVPGARVLIVFTYRPEFTQTWGGRSYHNQITLNRLSNRESLLILPNLFNAAAVDSELQRIILSKTEGVPFFIEEFVKSLNDLEVIEKEGDKVLFKGDPQVVAMPSTIQDTIMARVDRLSDAAKAVLQASSAIEREFRYDLVSGVMGLPEEEILTHFTALKDAELLYERGVYPQSSYFFRHALIREVVYDSIMSSRRKELHYRIGSAIEEIHRDDLADHYEILSEHFYQSDDYAKAADYSKRAARKAEKSASIPDAIVHMRKRIRCLEKLPETEERIRERIDARTFLGLYLTQINHWAEAWEAVEPVADLAKDDGFSKRLGQIQNVRGCYYGFVEEDFPKAFEALNEALRIAQDESDFISLILTSMWLGVIHFYNCDFEKTINSFQRGVDICIMAESDWGIAAQKAQQAFFGYCMPGNISAFTELSSEALEIAEESGDPLSRGISNAAFGNACFYKRHLADAENYAREGRDLCERLGFVGWAGIAQECLAETYFEMGEYDKARECVIKATQSMQAARINPSGVLRSDLALAWIGVMLGDRDVKLAPLRTIAEKEKIKLYEGWVCKCMGEILLNLGSRHFAEAEQWIQRAIEADTRNGVKIWLGFNYALYGDFFKLQGDRIKAQNEIGKAVKIFRECGADGWVEKYEKQLSELS